MAKNTEKRPREVLPLIIAGLSVVTFSAGLLLAYHSSADRSSPGYECRVEDVAGTGAALTVVPEVTAFAAAPEQMFPEVVVVAERPGNGNLN